MKFLIFVTVLFAVALAKPYEEFVDETLPYPFKWIGAYMQCVPPQIDQISLTHGCDSIWKEFRAHYIEKISKFQNCGAIEDDGEQEG